jgi:kynureninase
MLSTNNIRNDFSMNDSIYLLNHSVGRPLKTSESNADELFFKAWKSNEPWHDWMQVFTDFQKSLGSLLHSKPENFCPQTNVSVHLLKYFFRCQDKKTRKLSY